MPANQNDLPWQAELIARYPALLTQELNGRLTCPDFPSVGDDWRLVGTVVGRISNAIAAAPAGSLHIGQIKEKFSTIRIYWSGDRGLTDAMRAAVDAAIELAEARSACTCEICGAPGRLFGFGGRYKTTYDEHGSEGQPGREIHGLENVHITIRSIDGIPAVRAQRYIRATDSFEEIDPSTLNLNDEGWRMARFRCHDCNNEGTFAHSGKHPCPECGSDNVQFALSIEELGDDAPLIVAVTKMAEDNTED